MIFKLDHGSVPSDILYVLDHSWMLVNFYRNNYDNYYGPLLAIPQ